MTLAQQPANDSGPSAPDGRHYPSVYHHHYPSAVVLQGAPPQQVASYIVAGPSGGHPGVLQGQPIPLPTPAQNHTYPSSALGHAAFPGSALNQPLLQQHTYIQQPVQQVWTSANSCTAKIPPSCPEASQNVLICHHESLLQWKPALWLILHSSSCCEVNSNGTADASRACWICVLRLSQMSSCYCSSTHHPHCSSTQQQQHYRPPVSTLPYNCPQSQNLPQQQGTYTVILKSRCYCWLCDCGVFGN